MGLRSHILAGSVLTLLLSLLFAPPASAQITVAVVPNQTTVPASATYQFSATVAGTTNTSVTWSILEGTPGGTITSAGLYTAPANAGTFHIVASSQANPSSSGTALVVVPGFYAPDMHVPRTFYAATLLQNGQVLLAGGQGGSGSATLNSAELYDPVAGTFTLTPNMTEPRNFYGAALLSNGQVLIAGGSPGSGTTATAEIYDPVANTFTATGSMTVPRSGLTATALPSGQVLIAGGTNCPSACVTTNTAELYIPGSGTFVATGSMNAYRIYQTATLLSNGEVLIAGGIDQNSNELSSTEIYNPTTGVFTIGPSMSVPRQGLTATLLANGEVLLAGGINSADVPLVSADIYNPSTNTVSPVSNLNIGRYYHTATLLSNGQVLVAGGDGSSGPVADAELFNPATGTFTLTGAMNDPRFYHSATLLSSGNVLIAGGGGDQTLASAELYNPANGQFTTKTPLLRSPRTYHTQTTLADGRILVAGGVNCPIAACNVLNSAEIYDPSVGQFAFTNSMADARLGHTATLLANNKVLIVGGWSSATTSSQAQSPLASAELYDPVANTFSLTGSLNTARGYHAATLLTNGQVLITGGQGAAGGLSSAEIYDPSSGTFSPAGNMTSVRYWHTATRLNSGQVLIVGGAQTVTMLNNPVPSFLQTAELFNPSTGLFTSTGAPVAAPERHNATLLGNGKVLIGNGAIGSQLYDSVSAQFVAAGPYPIIVADGQIEAVAALLPNGQVLQAGAVGLFSGFLTSIYDPASNVFVTSENLLYAHANGTASNLPNGNVVIIGGAPGDIEPTDTHFGGQREVDIYESPLPVGVPSLTSVTPSTLSGFNPVTIAIQGSGFLPNAVATITNSSTNDTALPTTYVSSTEVTAILSPAYLAEVGSTAISVSNAGGLSSAPLTILVQNPLILIFPQNTALSYGSLPVGGSSDLTVTIDAGGNAPLVLTAVSINGTNPGDFALSPTSTCPLTGGTVPPLPANCTIVVSFVPNAPGGLNAQLSISSNSSPNPATVALVGTATQSPNISFSPLSLTFGNQQVGTSSPPQTIAVTNTGDSPLTIAGFFWDVVNNPNFSQTNNCPSSLAASATCTVTVIFTPGTSGSLSNAIVVDDNAPTATQVVNLSGMGTNLSLAPATGNSSSDTITTNQSATYNLQATPAAFSGTLALSVNCSSVPGATCGVSPSTIAVTPAGPTPFSVTVTPAKPSSSGVPLLPRNHRPVFFPALFGALACAFLLTLQILRDASRHNLQAKLSVFVLSIALAALIGCTTGGGSTAGSTAPQGTQGTPAGTYTVMVTAQGQGNTQNLNLTLIVQ